MAEVKFHPNDKGAFVIEADGERQAELVIGIVGQEMTVYHTGVLARLQGQGMGQQLVDALCDHARNLGLKVTTYCPFVKSRFQANPEKYADIWTKTEPQLKLL